jgi:NRAMP (natural resistance-associated macrophage protein)-like metal ion transporter
MRKRLGKYKWTLFLAAIGPGLISANADNDAGGITTYSLAGAQFGYSLIWVLVLVTISLAVTQEMGMRMGAVTGKGFGGLIREKFGAKWSAFAIFVMLIANLGTTTAEFAGISASLQMFGISKYISIPAAAVLVLYLITRFDFRRVQKVFLVSSALYLTYVISGVLAHPEWGTAVRSVVHPSIQLNTNYLLTFVAVIGTTITPWGQFFIQSYIVDKRLDTDDLPYARADVLFGGFFTNFIAFFIIIACAATIWRTTGGHVNPSTFTAAQAAEALRPLAGAFARNLFAFGLFNASLLGAAILPLTSSYATCETFGWEAGIDKKTHEAPIFYGLFIFFIALSSIIVLATGLPSILVMFMPQVLNGMLLPIILIFVLKITNDVRVMGRYTNSRVYNVIAYATVAGLILMTVLLLASPLIARFAA